MIIAVTRFFARDVPASEILTKEVSIGVQDEAVLFEDCKSAEHQGQGDGPPVEASVE